MKTFSKTILILILALTCFGCSKKSGTASQEPERESTKEEQAEYYVKYITDVTSRHVFPNRQVVVTSENGSITLQGVEIETVIGPVKKGFTCSLRTAPLSNEDLTDTSYIAYIYVSRGSEPFALKAMQQVKSKEGHNISYTIDF